MQTLFTKRSAVSVWLDSPTLEKRKIQQLYTLYFSDPAKTPKDVDITDIEHEYKNFYH